MSLGKCRHCGEVGIAADAPLCRYCGGWRPNPGSMTKLGVAATRAISLTMLIGSVAFLILANGGGGGLFMYAFPFIIGGSSMLFRSLTRPYGQEHSA